MLFITTNAQTKVEKLIVYKSFWVAGTTVSICNMFKNPTEYKIDTSNINTKDDSFIEEFSEIIAKSKRRKHSQQKLTIDLAGEFWINKSDRHFFIVCLPDLIIDMSKRTEYRLTDKIQIKHLQYWVENIQKQ